MLKNIEKESNINLSDNAENLSNISDNVLLEIEEVLDLLNQANDLYIETGNTELSAQTTKNIQIIESFLSKDKKS